MPQQTLIQKQQVKILPQQIQMLQLFHLNTLELEQRIRNEMDENPLLDEEYSDKELQTEKFDKDNVQDYQDWEEHGYDDTPDYKLEYRNYLSEDRMPEKPVTAYTDFREDLKQQFYGLGKTDKENEIAEYLIDCLNDNGMLEQDIPTIVDDYSFNAGTVVQDDIFQTVLEDIRSLEPAGIGAMNIQECFLLQLARMDQKRPDVKKAVALLRDHYTDLCNRNLEKIMQRLNIDDEELRILLKMIASLKMKPVTEQATHLPTRNTVIPDFVVSIENGEIEVTLARERSSSLYISQSWMERVESSGDNNKMDKSARQYLKSKLNSAQWFINAIRQRESTMLRVMKAIVKRQREYFLRGDVGVLKPMILKNIAEDVGVDISTISRITCNKYAETPMGTILLKDLFTEGISNQEGVLISNKVIQNAIQEEIHREDKKNPYTDQQLVTILSNKGYNIARRTIAKYRELMQIPVAQMRALWV